MTRPELLEQFRQFDTQTLEKLLTYGTLFIIPEEDLLVNVTMKDMVTKGWALADEFFPQWTDRSKADFGQFMLEMVAMFSEKDYWYLNAYAGESHLRNMSLYSTAFVRAIEMGYDPVLQIGAAAPFTVTIAPGAAVNVSPGGLVVALPNGLQFTNDKLIPIPETAQDYQFTITLREGSFTTSSNTFNGHEASIGKTGIDIDSLTLEINNTPWQRVRVFGQSGPQSKHFSLLPDQDANVTAYFGDDGYGLRPNVGDTFLFSFRTCNGADGNCPKSDTAAINHFPSGRLARSVVMVDASTGGLTQESLASIKNSAPLYARFKKAAFNETSVENFLLSQYNVQKAKCTVVAYTVYIYVVTKDPTTDETTMLNALGDLIQPYLMYGYEVKPNPTTYIQLSDLTVELYALKGTNLRGLEQKAAEIITDYTDPRVLAQYGQDFSLSDLADLLRSRLTGLQNVRYISVNGVVPTDINVGPTKMLKKIDPAVLNISAFIK
jgi:hypothetical protein